MALSWYKIREIPFTAYVQALKPIYDILEHKNKSKGNDDPFLKTIMFSHAGMTQSSWEMAENQRRYEKALQMKMGDFHEELAGKLPGYQTLCLGDDSGCDIVRTDGTEIWEWKNRDNTMNADSAKSVIAKLTEASKTKKAFLVLVNSNKKKVPRFGAPEQIQVLNGQEAYAYMSGRKNFFNDLQSTLQYSFSIFKTHDELSKLLSA